MKEIIEEIIEERKNQEAKWGEQNHSPDYWMVILMEEVGEACHEICGKFTDLQAYRKELVQVAAVAVAALESFDRQLCELA
jgi:NTP pyrophosphatase (non-canonical NTP hydrolase)